MSTPSPETPATDDVDPNEATSLEAWKVLAALITLGVVVGAFLALTGYFFRVLG